jgi:hypothetical protein
MPIDHQKRCGAKAKSTGKPCQGLAMPNGRCRVHGGPNKGAPKGNKSGQVHGVYDHFYSEEEKEFLRLSKIGDLKAEIDMVKVRIYRTMKIINEIGKDPDTEANKAGMEIAEIIHKESEQFGSEKIVTRKRSDFDRILRDLLGRLAILEKAQRELQGDSKDTANQQAAGILEALKQMQGLGRTGVPA